MRSREKVFGPGWAVPLDRNAKARIAAYARAWSAHNCRPGQQHKGPITRAFLDVLEALLWGFHNSRSVAEALCVLEWAGVLTWQHRITRIRERCRDLFEREGWRWRVVRTSNAYVFRDPGAAVACHAAETCRFPSKSENRAGTPNQVLKPALLAPAAAPNSPLECALASLGALITAKDAYEGRC
jgi:hypothetical protein